MRSAGSFQAPASGPPPERAIGDGEKVGLSFAHHGDLRRLAGALPRPAAARRQATALSAGPLLVAAALLASPVSVDSAAPGERDPAPPPPLDRARELHRQGRLDEALALYLEVAGLPGEDPGNPASAAAALNNACVIETDRGDFPAAVALCRRALALRRTLDDERGLSRTLNNLGLALYSQGLHREAEDRFLEALAINRRRGDAEAETINLANLAVLATVEGRFAHALERQREVVALAERHGGEPWAAEQRSIALVNQGVLAEKLGAYRRALELYRRVLAEGDGIDARHRAQLEVNVGVILRNLGDPMRAIEAFRRSAAAFEALRDNSGLSNALLNEALALHLNLGETAAAEVAYRRALALAEKGGDRTEEIRGLFYLGRLLLESGRLDESAAVFDRCLTRSDESDSAEGRWSALEGRGRVARARGEPERALADFERALAEVERAGAGVREGELRAGHFGDKRSLFGATVEVLAALDRERPGAGFAERALEVVQRAKARALLDALEAESPAGEARGGPLAPLSAAAIIERAGDAPLLEYFFGERRLYLLRVAGGSVRLLDLGPEPSVLEPLGRLRRALERGADPDRALPAELSSILLADGAASLSTGTAIRIAAGGGLHHLPVALLPVSGGDGELLLDRVAVVYLPSASALGRRAAAPDARVAVAGFGDPLFDPDRATARSASGESGRDSAPGAPGPADPLVASLGLPPLPASGRELASLAKRLGGWAEIRLGAEATEEAVRAAAARGARVVHFATHTVLDDRPGRGAAILLTPEGADDGLLRPREIAALDYRAGLTVLAACRTADPSAAEGNALATLTGAFLAGGSSAVLATLWDVDDETTAAFMEQLYARLAAGAPPAEALRRTKLALRADPRWARPSIWAAYVLVGDSPPVASPRIVPVWAWAVAALLALGAILFAMRGRGATRG